jgi:hypothetical protein
VLERKIGFFVKIKEDENFNRRNTGSISRINPPKFGGGLKFESDPREIGFAFHGAVADTCPPSADWRKRQFSFRH